MYLSTSLALASSAAFALAHPLTLSSRSVASFPAGSYADIILNRPDSITATQIEAENVASIDIDLFDTDAATIADLKKTMNVICYFSAGSREDWRPDAGDFQDGDTGVELDGWPGENWVNVKSDNVKAIMKARIQLASTKGCSAVDPDNVDGFEDNQDGFGYDMSAYVDYVQFMATEAASLNLAIGLKNAIDMIPDLISVVQFAVNEECHVYDECDAYKPFTAANKAVFNIEYGGDDCTSPSGVTLSTLIKPSDEGLNTLGGMCAAAKSVTTSAAAQSSAPASTPTSTTKPKSSTPVSTPAAKSASASPSTPAKSVKTSSIPTSASSVPSHTPTTTTTATATATASGQHWSHHEHHTKGGHY